MLLNVKVNLYIWRGGDQRGSTGRILMFYIIIIVSSIPYDGVYIPGIYTGRGEIIRFVLIVS